MSKHNNLVQIPVGHVCIPCAELFDVKSDNLNLFTKNVELRSQIKDFKERITALEVDLAAFESEIADLKKDLDEKQDRVLYWYQKYTDLADKLNAVKDHAETEET